MGVYESAAWRHMIVPRGGMRECHVEAVHRDQDARHKRHRIAAGRTAVHLNHAGEALQLDDPVVDCVHCYRAQDDTGSLRILDFRSEPSTFCI